MKKNLLMLLTCLVFIQLHAKIIESPTFTQFEEVLETLDPDSLVLLDVDETLLVPKDGILKNGGEEYRKILGFYKRNFTSHLIGQLLSRSEYEAVNPRAVDAIDYLQARDIKTIAFTACSVGQNGVIPSMEDWRIEHLKKNQFDFTVAFPQFSGLWIKMYKDDPLSRLYYKKPLFKEGVLFCNGHHKGPVLTAFLAAIGWKPSKIVFLDDRLDFLESVENALKQEGIEFIGLHYTEAKNLPCIVNEQVAKFQIMHFFETEEWLSEQEAEQYIQAHVSQ